jgi:hypothetical protein
MLHNRDRDKRQQRRRRKKLNDDRAGESLPDSEDGLGMQLQNTDGHARLQGTHDGHAENPAPLLTAAGSGSVIQFGTLECLRGMFVTMMAHRTRIL